MKKSKTYISMMLILLLFLTMSFSSFAHSGRLDSLGGHNVKTAGTGYEVGTYHYHQGIYAGWIVDNKGDVPNDKFTFDNTLITDNLDTSKASIWAVDELNDAYKNGLLCGVRNRFSNKLQDNITRAEFCKLIYNYLQENNPDYTFHRECKFNDIENNYRNEVITAYRLGIVNGYSDTKFNPNALITREQIACMIYRYLAHLTNYSLGFTRITIKDQNQIASWADKEVNCLASLNLIKGTKIELDGITFNPKANTTVEQAIVLLNRIDSEKNY